MSNSLAIAAVTATLQRMLSDASNGIGANLPPNVPSSLNLNSISVTTRTPDRARQPGDHTNQLNIFLYQTLPNAAFRNMDMPSQTRPGETGQPPAALTLHYLLSAYPSTDDDTASHVLLGQAVRILNDNAVLDPNDIRNALPGNDLYAQVERVRITPLPISVEDISKLWTAFATNYRVSAAYEISVVLIESSRSAKTPLPVLTRGKDDTGVASQADMLSPFPTLVEVLLTDARQPSARLGQSITLTGYHLDGDGLTARFTHPRLPAPIDIALPPVTTGALTSVVIPLPDTPADRLAWAAGFYTVSLIVSRASDPVNPTRTTNALSFSLAPRILTIVPPSAPSGTGFDLTLTSSPAVQPEQRASVLFGGSEVVAQARALTSDPLLFPIAASMAAAPGKVYLRLRVDGVDSVLVDYSTTPPKFDAAQVVTLT